MRYKGKLQPSYLLCPEVYTWHLLDDGEFHVFVCHCKCATATSISNDHLVLSLPRADILKMLDQSQYCRFNVDNSARDLNEFNPATDLNNIRLLSNYRTCLTYREYKEVISARFCIEWGILCCFVRKTLYPALASRELERLIRLYVNSTG